MKPIVVNLLLRICFRKFEFSKFEPGNQITFVYIRVSHNIRYRVGLRHLLLSNSVVCCMIGLSYGNHFLFDGDFDGSWSSKQCWFNAISNLTLFKRVFDVKLRILSRYHFTVVLQLTKKSRHGIFIVTIKV